MDQIGLNRPKCTVIGPNRTKWTELTEWAKLDRSRTNGPNSIKVDRSGLKQTKSDQIDEVD